MIIFNVPATVVFGMALVAIFSMYEIRSEHNVWFRHIVLEQ